MKRKFITNLGFLLVLNFFIKPIYVFGIDRVVQKSVGAEVYGHYFTLFNIAIIFQIFLDLGIENFIRREISRHPESAPDYFSNILVLKGILLVPYLFICFILGLTLGIDPSDYPLLFLILFNQFLASLILFLRANLGGLQVFKSDSILSVLDRSFMILIVGSLLLYPVSRFMFRINWFVIGQTFSYCISLVVGFILLRKRLAWRKVHIDLKQLIPIIKKLRPYAVLILLMAVYYRSDSIFLTLLLPNGSEQAGIFAHGFRIIDFMSNYALLFPILLLPIFSRTLHLKQKIDDLLQLSSLLLIVPSLTVIAGGILYRYELLDLLYDEHIQASADSFGILTISFLGMCVNYTFGALLTANGNLKQLNLMAGFTVLLSIALNLLLIPRFEVLGASITNASSLLFTIIVQLILVIRIFKLRINSKLIVKLILYFLLLILTAIVLKKLNVNWILGYVIIVSVGLFFAMVIRLISIKGLFTIIRQKED